MTLLSGVRVLEIAGYVSGPFSTLMLADLGATVTKVEPPGGDPFRRFGRRVNGASVLSAGVNRGKRSIVLDLKSPEGRARLQELLGDADVLVTNWRPGVAEHLGLAPEQVRRSHPHLIWMQISGFGQDGPLHTRPAFDSVIQARTGLAAGQGDEQPELVRSYFVDKVTASLAALAAVSALHRRQETGAGCVIDLSMLHAVAYFNFPDLLVEEAVPAERTGKRPQTTAVRPIATADGWMVVSPVSGRHMRLALEVVGHPEWVDDLRAIEDPTEVARRMFDLLETVTGTRTSAEWDAAFTEAGVPCSPILDFSAHLSDPQVIHSEIYATVEDPSIGQMLRARFPIVVDGQIDREPGRPAPLLDEHGADA